MILLILELFIPLIISNTLHMVIVKKNIFPAVATPIHQKLFGENKTYRGFLVLMILNSFFHYLFNRYALGSKESLVVLFMFGAFYGFLYCLFELPNSYMKRKFGIKPGESASKHKALFTILDKSDSTLGLSVIFCLIKGQSFMTFIVLYICAFLTHLSFSGALHKLKIKESL